MTAPKKSRFVDRLRRAFQGGMEMPRVRATVDRYAERFDRHAGTERAGTAASLTRDYYQLVTDFYEYGWGQSFHFAPIAPGETVARSLRRFEIELGAQLGVGPGTSVLDVGCGVGGPMRTIARSTGARVTGVTISPYQIERGRAHNRRSGLDEQCTFVEADFNRLPFEPGSFDGAYTIAACCHAGDRRGPFAEVLRVLRPGARFVGSDWCMTQRYRDGDAEHERIKQGIEKGNGIARLVTAQELDRALRDVGFEIEETRDLAEEIGPDLPWYDPLRSGVSLRGFRNSRVGAAFTHGLVTVLEKLRLAPEGTVKTHDVLRLAQRALVEGGELGIFTALYGWVARKPD